MASFSFSHFPLTSTQTALTLIVPQNLEAELNSLRRIHDKAFRKWDPHINILYPFVEPTRLFSAVAILRETLRETHSKRVRINLDEVGVFKHRKNATVFLKPDVESEESASQLRKILVHALGCNERDGTHDGVFRPHLTVGQAALNDNSINKLVEQVEKLVGLGWESMSLAVLRRESSGEMRVVEELRLGNLEDTKNDGEHSCGYSDA
jgi:2'-5' RNA ligase